MEVLDETLDSSVEKNGFDMLGEKCEIHFLKFEKWEDSNIKVEEVKDANRD